ncbi:stalk domain-containing protein [Paenibacillus kobensis]|uniref:stalk domain-containing protein n=1 Tax=Paenibacillus kobensis TaxID=59841 RepID=UPI000FD7E055|nr:stalk domain-containing protein [Paenibacillus kobensis]
MNKQFGTISMVLAVLLGSLASTLLEVSSASATSSAAGTLSASATQPVSSDDSGTSYAVRILDELNAVRTAMGLPAVKLNPYLTKAAQNHAVYMIANVYYNHDENPRGQGFTGVTHADRIHAVGGDTSIPTWEIITVDESDPHAIIEEFLNTAYHREPLIAPDATEIGVGVYGSAVVIEIACAANTMGYATYPYDGQTNVMTTFSGHEIPNPLEQFGTARSGQIITIKTPYLLEGIDVTLTDRAGDSIPLFHPFVATNYWHIIPQSPLAYNETYTVSVTFTPWAGSDAGKTFNKTWSFTTESAAAPYSQNNIGIQLNGTYITVSPQPRMITGSTFIPLRGVFEKLGATISYNAKDKSIDIIKDSTAIHLQIGNKSATVDGKRITLVTAPFTDKNGFTFVPLRFASEALDAAVTWDAASWTAVIDIK